MNIEEIRLKNLNYLDKVIVKVNDILFTEDDYKATFVALKQLDKRNNKIYLVVKLYKCQNQICINIENLIDIRKGWS